MGFKVSRTIGLAIAAASIALAGTPLAAQSFSESYQFLKAVKERDGNKVQEIVTGPGGRSIINIRDRDSGEAALHIVVRQRNFPWIGYLLGKGARADIQNDSGETPLAIAAQIGFVEGAQRLLAGGASVDLPNGRGETPLILAVQKRDIAMVRLLVGKGADPKRTDRAAGFSALDYAQRDGRSAAIVKVLEEAKAPAKAAMGPSL